MAGIKFIVNAMSSYTSKGCTLLRKQNGLPLTSLKEEFIKGIKLTDDAASYDAVRVGKNFDGANCFEDIITIRNKDGKIIQRFRQDVNGEEIKNTVRKYSDMGFCEIERNGIEIPVKGRKITGYERVNGEIENIFTETQAVTSEKNPILSLFKRTTTHHDETIHLGEYQNGIPAKTIDNVYTDFSKIPGVGPIFPGLYKLNSSKVSNEALKEIAEHPYFLPYVSKYNKFIHRAGQAHHGINKYGLRPKIKIFKEASPLKGFYNRLVNINNLDAKGYLRDRESLMQTIAHEIGHRLWGLKVGQYNRIKNGSMKFEDTCLTLDDIEHIKKYQKSIENYVSSESNYAEYYKQFAERMARVEGKEGTERYYQLNSKMRKEFPNTHDNQFYEYGDEIESTEDIGTLFNTIFGETRKDLDGDFGQNKERFEAFLEMIKKKNNNT